jgi:hypothetical protein
MFKRKKEKKPGYEVKTLGSMIIERVQLPHSLVKVDGSKYEILMWDYRLRIDNGPILFERAYAIGTPKSLVEMQRHLTNYVSVDNAFEAEILFYQDMVDNAFRRC